MAFRGRSRSVTGGPIQANPGPGAAGCQVRVRRVAHPPREVPELTGPTPRGLARAGSDADLLHGARAAIRSPQPCKWQDSETGRARTGRPSCPCGAARDRFINGERQMPSQHGSAAHRVACATGQARSTKGRDNRTRPARPGIHVTATLVGTFEQCRKRGSYAPGRAQRGRSCANRRCGKRGLTQPTGCHNLATKWLL